MAAAIIIYVILLIIFLIISSLVFRQATKFGYLAPRFKIVAAIFGILSFTIIVFSIYLLMQLGGTGGSGYTIPDSVKSSGGLNF
jgi:hypothetical protein